MKKSVNLAPIWLLSAIIIAIAALVVWNTSTSTGDSLVNADKSVGVPADNSSTDHLYKPVKEPRPASDKRKGRDLVNASEQDVGNYVKLFASQQLKAKGDPEVRLVRNVTREQVAALGLGCLPDFSSIEQPPLILVILKGEFDFSRAMPGSQFLPGEPDPPGKQSFAAYVFDAWAAFPAALLESQDGSLLKKALNDPTLPDPQHASGPIVCPTQVPASEKKWHYGEDMPGSTGIPPLPDKIQRNALPTEPVPPTIIPEGMPGTPGVPLPIPTTQSPSLLPTAPPDY